MSQTLLGLCAMYPAPGIIERIGRDWDWIWLDGQHGQIAGYDTMLAMVRACHSVGRPAFVRVAGHEPSGIGLALDMGADAVIVPQVDTAEQAKALVHATKFPPMGNRSFGGRRPIDMKGRGYNETANDEVQLICQIESPEALKRADQIAAISGVDALFLGPDDMRLRRKEAGLDQGSEEDFLKRDIESLVKSCREAGKAAICVGADPKIAKFCVTLGVRYLVGGGDVSFLAGGSAVASARIREMVSGTEQEANAPKKSEGILPIY